ncbi:MAG: Phosphate-selective porin [Bacteroidetes bacterium]|nr:Phosphate-selective porin [Bacteroidota bacterium]
MLKKFSGALLFVLLVNKAFAGDVDVEYKPQIEGTIRAKYEYNESLSEHRFQVRNARFSINGRFSPIVSYKAEIDLSDEGETKMLDAYLRLQPVKWFNFTIGQQKVPFSTDNLRSPHQLYFANRSFIGKQLTGLRDVGATFAFSSRKSVALDFMAGIYNGTGLYNQKTWRKGNELSYVLRAVVSPVKSLNFTANFNSIAPYEQRMNMFNVGGFADVAGLHIESEFFYKAYSNGVFDATKGFFCFAAYDIKTPKLGHINKITPLVRYDMMTNNNKGKALTDGTFAIDDVQRSRITGGLTLSLDKPFLNDIRINYEHYFFADGVVNDQNKLVLEYVVRF